MMTFETDEGKRREKRAIETFVKIFDGSFFKLDQNDIDYKIFDSNKQLIAYVEVVPRVRTMIESYPLSITIGKLSKLNDKRLNPTIIWSCEDGIIYGKIDKLKGIIKYDKDLTAYFEKQKSLKYVRYF
jgi:hypothetical protein